MNKKRKEKKRREYEQATVLLKILFLVTENYKIVFHRQDTQTTPTL